MTAGARALTAVVGMLTCVMVACVPRVAHAQAHMDAAPGRIELGVGWMRIGRIAVGSGDATETTSAGGSLSLFSTSTELGAGNGVEGRVGVALTRAFACEASGSYAAPRLRTQISGDYESDAAFTATETVHQLTAGGALLWYVRPPQVRARTIAAFLAAGGGYRREVHQGAALADTGHFLDVGGGLKVLLRLREQALVKGVGLRIDARVQARTGGIVFDGASRLSPTLGVSLFGRF